MTPDPKWLEILKASGWQTTAGAAAFGLFLLADRQRLFPPLDPWMIQAAALGFFLCACLSVGSIGSAFFKFIPISTWILQWIKIAREKRAVRDYIPHMTPKERQIIAYLLEKNQKVFTADQDGGYATSLISQGIVAHALRQGQMFTPSEMPMLIRDHIWDELRKHKDQFPYTPAMRGRVEVHPWRVDWSLR